MKGEALNEAGETWDDDYSHREMTGLELITKERERQINEKGYTPEHDDEHDLGELALAAALYALPYDAKQGDERLITQDDFIGLHIALETGCDFILKPELDEITRLAKAAAMIAAEIDRIKRAKRQQQDVEGDVKRGLWNKPDPDDPDND